MDDIRDYVGDDVTTRKDIHNIEKSFGLRKAERHKDDAMSVDVWVQEMVNSDTNPVLLYKPQGRDTSCDCPSLERDDFMLVLQTPLQTELLNAFGKNIICISDVQWSVKSNDHSQEYTIILENSNCPMDCQLVCRECAVCIHTHLCTCMDYTLFANIYIWFQPIRIEKETWMYLK